MILSRICNHITESSYATKITLKYTTQKGNNESQTSEREIAPTRLGLAGPTVPPQNVIFEKRQMRSNGGGPSSGPRIWQTVIHRLDQRILDCKLCAGPIKILRIAEN